MKTIASWISLGCLFTLLVGCAKIPSNEIEKDINTQALQVPHQTIDPESQLDILSIEEDSSNLSISFRQLREGSAPNGPTCDRIQTASWGEISLYELTYGCIPRGWRDFFLRAEVRSEIMSISDLLEEELAAGFSIEPPIGDVFRALYSTTPRGSKAVILGQDPAPQPGVAMGLSFSTRPGVSSGVTASIQRVLLAAQNQGFCVDLDDGNLQDWADQGVLLLNMALSIRCQTGSSSCEIASHLDEWRSFTRQLFEHIDDRNESKVFIFWGSAARQYINSVNNPNHLVITGGHPSPAGSPHGRRFFCRQYFEKANDWLADNGISEVDWSLNSSCEAVPAACNWTWLGSSGTSRCHSQCPESSWMIAERSAINDALTAESASFEELGPLVTDAFRPLTLDRLRSFSFEASVQACEFQFMADRGAVYSEALYLEFLEEEIRSRIGRSSGNFEVSMIRVCPGRDDESISFSMNSDFLYILGINGEELEPEVVRYTNDDLELSRNSLHRRFDEGLRFAELSLVEQQGVLKMFAFVVAEGARFSHVEGSVKNFLSSDCSYNWTDFARLVRRWKTISIFANTRGIARGQQHVGGSRAFLIIPITNYMVRTYNSAVSDGWQVTRSRYGVRVSDRPISLASSHCQVMIIQ